MKEIELEKVSLSTMRQINRDKLIQPIQMHLSKKQKPSTQFFSAILQRK